MNLLKIDRANGEVSERFDHRSERFHDEILRLAKWLGVPNHTLRQQLLDGQEFATFGFLYKMEP